MDTSNTQSSPRGEEGSSQSGEEDNQLRRSSRQVRLNERYKDYALMSSVLNVIEPMILMKLMNMKSGEKQ
jgi:hypothetical protein